MGSPPTELNDMVEAPEYHVLDPLRRTVAQVQTGWMRELALTVCWTGLSRCVLPTPNQFLE